MTLLAFLKDSVRLMMRGSARYYAWVAFLLLIMVVGVTGYVEQLTDGLIRSGMRDPVSWGFYIGNFTFLVGVAAAAVVLVIPAYIYNWKPIKEIVVIGELLAVSSILMCMLFVTVDIGRPDRIIHLFPVIGRPNFPRSLLSWDVLVLNAYFFLNLIIAFHVLFRGYQKREYSKRFAWPLILLSIPAAVSIHTVTAFLYNGLAARAYWNAAILAPRFLTSAFCSGPAIILVLLQILRRTTRLEIRDEALWKIAELMAYAMFINLFLLGAELFREFYSNTHHLVHYEYLFLGIHGHDALVPFAWFSVLASTVAFLLFLMPKTRRNPITLNIGAVLIFAGVYIEKGMALVIPGFTPSMLGEIYEYTPTWTEWRIAMGVFATGFLVFTLLLKVAVPIMMGTIEEDLGRVEDREGKLAKVA
jgi:molybdopterin-containing oxidoreductase family membrane subunit